jgi:putative ubiquitin-RnfH superfamily antitoxin RatB of RatAB toxin-antitoxin module
MTATLDEGAQAWRRLRRCIGCGDADRVETFAPAILDEERLGRRRVFDQKSRSA